LAVILTSRMKKLKEIAFVGNPNSGKSSLFNLCTGLNQKVGNFPGVTVDKKTGTFEVSAVLQTKVVDLPGSYSLYPRRADEWISYRILLGLDQEVQPDLFVIVADASNLKRNLLYATQLIDLKLPAILVLTMLDVAAKQEVFVNLSALEAELGIPVIAVNPRSGEGFDAFKKVVEKALEENPVSAKTFFLADPVCTAPIERIIQIRPAFSFYGALHLLLHQEVLLNNAADQQELSDIRAGYPIPFARLQGEEITGRYKKISEILSVSIQKQSKTHKKTKTDRIDLILLHPVWGYTILLFVLFLLFQSVFWIAEYPMSAIETGFVWLEKTLAPILPEAWYSALLLNGILPGLSGILVFVPQIMILFGLVSVLEETGYMARISFMTDRVMRKVGLNGKSVMPMISGFACAVPAIMSVRNIENRKERLLTILITPLMSCSARLPVYTILIALVIPNQLVFGVLSLQGLVMMGLYLFGVLMALTVAWIARYFIRIREKSFFILELPLYKSPRWKNVLQTMFEKAKIFVTDAGKVIMIISLILWALSSYGPPEAMKKTAALYDSQIQLYPDQQATLLKEKDAALLQTSFAGWLGKYIEPAIQPLGYDWKIGIALITSFAAREVFVGTMATLYSVDNGENNQQTLREKMQAAERSDGTKVYTLASGVSLMLFYLLAMQCMSTLAVVKRETNSWKWPLVQLLYMSALAYLFSFIAFQLLN